MPRVHGIDIAPRRGRGRSRPRSGFGGGGGGNFVAAAAHASPVGGGSNREGAEASKDENDNPTLANDYSSMSLASSSPRINGSGDNHDVTRRGVPSSGGAVADSNDGANLKPAAATSTSPPAPSPASNKAVEPTTAAKHGINIQPIARESLNQLEFGAHSFSVQEISHKSPPKFNNSTHISTFSSMGLAPSLRGTMDGAGIAPSLETTGEKEVQQPAESETAPSIAGKDEAKAPPSADTKEAGIEEEKAVQNQSHPLPCGLNGDWQSDNDVHHRREMIQHM